MRPFPEDYELLGFFEVEPTVLDKEVPWAYNELTFKTEASNGILETRMQTGSEIMEIKWFQDNNLVLHLELVGVFKIEIGDGNNGIEHNTLVASFRNDDIDKLIIKVRPYICFKWGYNDHP